MVKDYVATNFTATKGRWITDRSRKVIVPASDSPYDMRRVEWWHTKAHSKEQAMMFISDSLAKTFNWGLACVRDIQIEEI